MRRIVSLLFLLVFLAAAAQAQQALDGVVRDANTREPLAFVSILINSGPHGVTTDIDGRFRIRSGERVEKLRFSYLGYETLTLELPETQQGPLNILLKPTATNLREVVVRATPGPNPAHRIIKQATAARKFNDPAQLASYTFRTYNKFVITAEPHKVKMDDTLSLATARTDSARTDTALAAAPAAAAKADSSLLAMQEFLARQFMFLSESVSDHSYIRPNLSKETVLATRVSGLKKPSFAMLGTDSRNFSVYQDLVNFFGRSYLSPLSEGSTKKYDFRLEDTTYSGTDTIFIISYQPFPDKNFEGLKGQLHISSDGWAVENIIAESMNKDQQGIRLQQHYKKVGSRWFPAQINTDYKVYTMIVNGHTPTAISRSYYSNIQLEPELRRRDFKAVTIQLNNDAHKQPEEFWSLYRPDTLDQREQNTYHLLDSVGHEIKLDQKVKLMEALLSKKLPLGPVSLRLDRILKVNRYEAARLGLGAQTNEKISRFFELGGYAGYGFRDKAWKYGSDLSFNLYRPSGFKLTLNYFEDITEAGGTALPFYTLPLLGNNLRPLIIRNMDKVSHQSAFFSARVLKYMDLRTGLQQEFKRSTNGYRYETSKDNYSSEFHFTEAVVGLRYAFREQVMQMLGQNISLGTKYPVLWLEYRRGLNNLLDGQFSYHRLDARVEKTLQQKALGRTNITLAGGVVEGAAPYSNLYNGNGAYSSGYHVYTGEGFQTMALTEFISDRYAALYFRHSFAKLLLKSKHFSPSLAVVTNVGIGSLEQPERHRNLEFKTMEKGFYESGLLLNDLLTSNFSSYGIGVFYRYGPYSHAKTSDNLVFKASFGFTF